MKLSEAILLGAMMSPQAFRALVRDDGTCALGAALLAIEPVSEPALRSVCKRWPWAVTVSADCPGCGRSCPVFGVITHLNDTHRWTREQIADWVASVEPAISTLKRAPDRRSRHDHADYVGKTSAQFVE